MGNNNGDQPGLIQEKSKEMLAYEAETGKNAIWKGKITKAYEKWLNGGKIYDKDRKRISFYVGEDVKNEWQEFAKSNSTKFTTLSEMIREAVTDFIQSRFEDPVDSKIPEEVKSKLMNDISHQLKVPLTSIKGYSQLLIKNYSQNLNPEIISKLESINNQCLLLEKKIKENLESEKTIKKKIDILLIEDDEANRKMLEMTIKSLGFECISAEKASGGLAFLELTNPKMVLLDIMLPDVSGFEVSRMIKENTSYGNPKVFFLSALTEREIKERLKESLADGFISKPFDIDFIEVFLKRELNK